MHIDWITWGIWGLGLLLLLAWLVKTVQEFKDILAGQRRRSAECDDAEQKNGA